MTEKCEPDGLKEGLVSWSKAEITDKWVILHKQGGPKWAIYYKHKKPKIAVPCRVLKTRRIRKKRI
jgi:hypothetical protein